MEVPDTLIPVLGILVRQALAPHPDGVSDEDKRILRHFVETHACDTCSKIGWHPQYQRCGWYGDMQPWEEELEPDE